MLKYSIAQHLKIVNIVITAPSCTAFAPISWLLRQKQSSWIPQGFPYRYPAASKIYSHDVLPPRHRHRANLGSKLSPSLNRKVGTGNNRYFVCVCAMWCNRIRCLDGQHNGIWGIIYIRVELFWAFATLSNGFLLHLKPVISVFWWLKSIMPTTTIVGMLPFPFSVPLSDISNIDLDITAAHLCTRRKVCSRRVTAAGVATIADGQKNHHWGDNCDRGNVLHSSFCINVNGALSDNGQHFVWLLSSLDSSCCTFPLPMQ